MTKITSPSPSQEFTIEVDGEMLPAKSGQTVAAVLLCAGIKAFRYTRHDEPRGLFCGMGVCFDCLVTIDGLLDQRACMTPARPEMHVRTHKSTASW